MGININAWLLVPVLIRTLIPQNKPGVYILGCLNKTDRTFVPIYVGRSDVDVRQRLLRHEKFWIATYFQVEILKSEREAFYHECFYWHAFLSMPGFLNRAHPASPVKKGMLCPFCRK